MKLTYRCFFALLVIMFLISENTFAQKKERLLVDTLDNALDLSNYLYNLNGFLPIISPITEPAVGYGAVVAGVFFMPKKKLDSDSKKFVMPDMVGAAGGLTENGTWLAGAGYSGYWNNDRIRYRGILAYAQVKLKYYGLGGGILEKYPIKFSLNSYFLLQQAIFRIGNSNFLLGGKYQFLKTNVILFENSSIPIFEPKDLDLLSSGIGFIAEYEKLNNLLSPTSGIRINITYDQYLEIIGSDRDNGRVTFYTHYYQPILKGWTCGLRVESIVATGDNPFYMLPFISLRGVPAMRYQGELTALLETEQQFMFTQRWGVVGFGGLGITYKDLSSMEEGATAWNAGVGFRYLIASLLGLKMGIDVARGPENWAFYVVFGSSWIR